MPVLETRYFGTIEYEESAVLEFPRGLPGFDERRRFVATRLAASDPLVYLQSLEEPGLCFITAPAAAVAPGYRLEADAEDLELVGLPPERQPEIGKEALCLIVLSMRETGPTANLLAPVIVNLGNRKAVQTIAQRPGYSHQHALEPEEAPVCS